MNASLIDRAREVAGHDHVLAGPDIGAAYAVDGVPVTAVARPGTPEEAGALLAAAGEAGAGVLPWGAGAHQHLGGTPTRADLAIETTRLTGITDYTPADYVVAVRAGTPFRDLQAELAKHNQWLPIDPPGAARATVGGLVAANRNGPRRLLWGSIRDLVIGIRAALPTGEVIKTGGKVVKNVAGYDLVKLFIGSLGAVGVITEVTFKISPLPEDGLTVLVPVPEAAAAHALTAAVMRSYLLPSALEVVNPAAFRRLSDVTGLPSPPAGAWGVLLLAEGMEESRTRHVNEMRSLVGGCDGMDVIEGEGHRALWTAVGEFPSPETHPGAVICRAGGPIARWGEFARALEPAGSDDGYPHQILAHVGVGLVYVAAAAESVGPTLAEALGRVAREVGGYAVVEAAPRALKARLPIWGAEPGAIELMRRLRTAYDPKAIMVPGRLGWDLS